jgi:5-methylcytosine-specific restriction enzyme subunit McrC
MIAVRNIYYLLLYAWDRFDEGRMAIVDAEPDTDLLNLLASVLTRGIDDLLRRGLDRGYVLIAEEIAGIRGKLDLSSTVKANLLLRARAACQFDELSHDVPHNQILKATLHRLLHSQTLDRELRERVRTAYQRLSGIQLIRLSERTFHSVQLHGNIQLYRFLIDVCQLLYEHLIPDEEQGTFRFRDFTRNEDGMRKLFERFLYNFYKHEQKLFKVQRNRFPWADALTQRPDLLPVMNTDVTLARPGHKIVIDAKYSSHVLQRHPYGSPTLNSGHLYQLFAYLKNLPKAANIALDGLIVYPLGKHAVDATIDLPGHRLRVYTIDLNQHWRLIRHDLLALVVPSEVPPV